MTQEIIDIGALANDGTGDPLRVAFDKINNNFTQLYDTASVDGPNGSVQFSLANTVGNVTTYSLSSSANLVFNSSVNRLDIKGSIVPLVPNNLNIGSTANTVGNIYLSNSGLKLGNVSFAESGNTVRIFNTNANVDANIQVNTITASTVDVAQIVIANTQFDGSIATSEGLDPNQVIYQLPEVSMLCGKFDIKSVADTSANNQSVTITINKSTSGGSVKYVVYGTTFNGDPVTRYDVDVAFGNVRIKVNPMVDDLITHTISYQVTN
jgi:hypothetical protein